MGGNTARNALPSESFGNAAPTTLSVWYLAWIRFHIGIKALTRCSAPRKYRITYLADSVGLARLPCGDRLRYQDSQGQFAQTRGVPRVSAALATALTVSGVEEANSMSTRSVLIDCWASWPARVSLDLVA